MFLFQLTFTILSPKSSPPLTLITLVFGFGGGDGDGGKILFGGVAVLGSFVVVVVVVKCVVTFLGFFVLISKAFGYFVEVIRSLGGGGGGVVVKSGGKCVL